MDAVNLNTFQPVPHDSGATKQLPPLPLGASICIIGAGAFGGWTALHLLRRGYSVTLVDQWGAGNSRSSSGDDTRVIRSTYGNNRFYFQLNVRSLELWKLEQQKQGVTLFHNAGVLWMCYDRNTPIVDESIPFTREFGMEYKYLDKRDLNKRFPLVNTNDLDHAYLDPFGGYLNARYSCACIRDAFLREGGNYIQGAANPGRIHSDRLQSCNLSNGSALNHDFYIFACGAWLRQIFPDVLGNKISCTRQEVYYFGTPSEHAPLLDSMPVWVDADGKDFYYGIPGNASRGFKVGVDIRGRKFDPTNDDRIPDKEVLERARRFLAHRFPVMKNAPLIESRVCPYETSDTGNFIFDQHPLAANVFLLGGGSGHGFKHGPALGELVSRILTEGEAIPDAFRLVS